MVRPMREYTPNRWEIVRFSNEKETWYRVLGGWSGGYLDGDSWRLSSGLNEIEESGDYYLMKNHSGSVYKCHKEGRGMNMISASTYVQMERECEEHKIEISTISVDEFLSESK